MAVPFLYVQAKGTYREIGRAVGEAARPLIAAAVAFYEEHFVGMAGIPFDEAERQALVARGEYQTAIRRLHLAGASLREVAQALAISRTAVRKVSGSASWPPNRAG